MSKTLFDKIWEKHVVKTGKAPVLEGAEWRTLLAAIPATTLRDRALIATLT